MISKRDLIIRNYFNRLKSAKIKYAVLRNYGEIFKDKGKDIDVLMNPGSFKIASKLFSEVCGEFSGNVLSSDISSKNLYLKAFVIDEDDDAETIEGLYIHITAFVTIKGDCQEVNKKYVGFKSWIDDFELTEVKVDGFYFSIPEPKIQLLYMLSKFTQKETFRHIYNAQNIVKLNNMGGYIDSLNIDFMSIEKDKKINIHIVFLLVNKLLNVSKVEKKFDFSKVKYLLVLFVLNIKQLLHFKGKIIFFSGPDGSGKTTANNLLTNFLSKNLSVKIINYKHLYPLSNATSLKAQKLQAKVRGIDFKDKDNLERDRGQGIVWKMRRMLGLLYALIQIWPGYLYGLYKNYMGYTLIIDTAFFDVFVKGHRPDFPILRAIATPLIPCGDYWFLMTAPAQNIVDRKPELTKQEIEEYYVKIEKISRHARRMPKNIQTNLGERVALIQMLKGMY